MSRTSLQQFVARILAHDRILFGDLKRLQRDVLPGRITTREDAETLLFVDSAVRRVDRAWTTYLTATVRDFVIWGHEPAGTVDRDKAEWLSAALARADASRTGRVIVREIVREVRSIEAAALPILGVPKSVKADEVAPASEPGMQEHRAPMPPQRRSAWIAGTSLTMTCRMGSMFAPERHILPAAAGRDPMWGRVHAGEPCLIGAAGNP